MENNRIIRRKVRNSYIVSTVSIALVLFLLGAVGYLMTAAMRVADSLQESVTLIVELEKGITDANEMFSQVKQTMLKSAKERILVVDHTKFNNIAFSKSGDLSSIDIVVTDLRPSDEWMNYFTEKGIQCLYGKETDEDDSLRE